MPGARRRGLRWRLRGWEGAQRANQKGGERAERQTSGRRGGKNEERVEHELEGAKPTSLLAGVNGNALRIPDAGKGGLENVVGAGERAEKGAGCSGRAGGCDEQLVKLKTEPVRGHGCRVSTQDHADGSRCLMPPDAVRSRPRRPPSSSMHTRRPPQRVTGSFSPTPRASTMRSRQTAVLKCKNIDQRHPPPKIPKPKTCPSAFRALGTDRSQTLSVLETVVVDALFPRLPLHDVRSMRCTQVCGTRLPAYLRA